MRPREATQFEEQSSVVSSFDLDDEDLDESLDSSSEVFDEPPVSERRSWRRVCAARRSIERLREQQALRADLVDVFDDDDDYVDFSDED